tara:strand:- start:392 stop:1252 length:861 start_codon:yes stop_codon:yes gene_type:complete
MDTIIGLGNAGCSIAERFAEYPQYKVLKIDSDRRPFDWLNNGFKLVPKQDSPEGYEKSFPALDDFFEEAGDNVLFILGGGGRISGATLRILEHLKDKKLSILYVQPDIELLPKYAKMQERATFGILQEYARSALFSRIYLVQNTVIEEILGDLSIADYYDKINEYVVSAIHMINVFKHSEPISTNFEGTSDVARISTFGVVDIDNGEEKLFFPLQFPREKLYYYAINKDRLKEDKGLHRKITHQVKSKISDTNINVTYGIYSTEYESDYVYSIVNASFVQGQQIIS